ncbi:YchJ family protein [Microbacterium lemovicicum]|nr:YchJ family protein [Microbacterium lemovicicum]
MTKARDGGLCPCGSGIAYDGCCAPAHRGEPPATAEALMRSRYSAFVRGDSAYLRDTWHPGTRPDVLDVDDGTRWQGLEILSAEGGSGDRRGRVEFRARWRDGAKSGVLHERSRFVFQSGRWWYLDGVVD